MPVVPPSEDGMEEEDEDDDEGPSASGGSGRGASPSLDEGSLSRELDTVPMRSPAAPSTPPPLGQALARREPPPTVPMGPAEVPQEGYWVSYVQQPDGSVVAVRGVPFMVPDPAGGYRMVVMPSPEGLPPLAPGMMYHCSLAPLSEDPGAKPALSVVPCPSHLAPDAATKASFRSACVACGTPGCA